jgi:glycosyltransferase involved in cell wall biosynthesis
VRATAGTSVVTTVRDDRDALATLLGDLAAQTRAPAELVVVDGGSTDGTRELLDGWSGPFPLRAIDAPGANISAGRNIGIAAARSEWIACTDAGCRPRPGWLAALEDAFAAPSGGSAPPDPEASAATDRGEVGLAAGIYVVDGRTPLERALAVSLYPAPDEIGDDSPLVALWQRLFGRRFEADHATGRSMAFSKNAWEAAGGFPEDLYAGEDVAFSQRIVAAGFEARLVPEAAVLWRPRRTWAANARMYRSYARGNVRVEGDARRHLIRLATWIGGPLLLWRGGPLGRLLALAGAAAYVSLPLRRAHRAGMPPRELWRIPLAIALKDLSQLAGAVQGLADRLRGIGQPTPERRED